jgi:hypothetical protein
LLAIVSNGNDTSITVHNVMRDRDRCTRRRFTGLSEKEGSISASDSHARFAVVGLLGNPLA